MKTEYWKNKTIVITGTSSGIGAAVLDLLKDFDLTIFTLNRSCKTLNIPTKAKIHSIACDISKEEEVLKATKEILSQTKTVDILFNNAGITTHGRFDETTIEVFRIAFDINFFGTVNLTLKLIEALKIAKGCVLTVSTVSGLYGIPGRSVYSSSKSALHAVFESLRIELSEFGVRSIIFCPPYTKTNLRTSGITSTGEKLNEAQYQGKILSPEEVAVAMIEAIEDKNSRLVTMDKSGFFVKILRLFAPAFLEKKLFQKLYKDFHHTK